MGCCPPHSCFPVACAHPSSSLPVGCARPHWAREHPSGVCQSGGATPHSGGARPDSGVKTPHSALQTPSPLRKENSLYSISGAASKRQPQPIPRSAKPSAGEPSGSGTQAAAGNPSLGAKHGTPKDCSDSASQPPSPRMRAASPAPTLRPPRPTMAAGAIWAILGFFCRSEASTPIPLPNPAAGAHHLLAWARP